MRRRFALAIVTASVAPSFAQPAPAEESECSVAPYLEPSLFSTVLTKSRVPYFIDHPPLAGKPVIRLAAGVRIPLGCAPADLEVRVGVSTYVSAMRRLGTGDDGYGHADDGFGAELEVTAPIEWLRLGGRIGVETAATGSLMLTIGVRARFPEPAWVGIDAFHTTRSSWEPACADEQVHPCSASTSGVMAGFGLTGRAGLVGSGLAVLGYVLARALAKEGT